MGGFISGGRDYCMAAFLSLGGPMSMYRSMVGSCRNLLAAPLPMESAWQFFGRISVRVSRSTIWRFLIRCIPSAAGQLSGG